MCDGRPDTSSGNRQSKKRSQLEAATRVRGRCVACKAGAAAYSKESRRRWWLGAGGICGHSTENSPRLPTVAATTTITIITTDATRRGGAAEAVQSRRTPVPSAPGFAWFAWCRFLRVQGTPPLVWAGVGLPNAGTGTSATPGLWTRILAGRSCWGRIPWDHKARSPAAGQALVCSSV